MASPEQMNTMINMLSTIQLQLTALTSRIDHQDRQISKLMTLFVQNNVHIHDRLDQQHGKEPSIISTEPNSAPVTPFLQIGPLQRTPDKQTAVGLPESPTTTRPRRPGSCSVCGKSFPSNNAIHRHLRESSCHLKSKGTAEKDVKWRKATNGLESSSGSDEPQS